MTPLSILGAKLNGERVDVLVDNGRIKEIRPAGIGLSVGRIIDAKGGLLTAPYADPHVHLDAVLLAQVCPNESGTLKEGIANWASMREQMTEADLLERATSAVKWCVAHGTGRIRTHVDCRSPMAVEALCAFREEIEHLVELQVVAFPQEGIFNASRQKSDLVWAVEHGVDAVGAIPHHEATPERGRESISLAFDLAEKHGIQIDLHCDETDDPESQHILWVCHEKIQRGFQNHVLAGHCTAMHSYSDTVAEKAIQAVVESRVQVVANPLDNIVLQGRGDGYPRRRGITRIPELLSAGALVGVGHDSIMDPWYPLGRGNLVDAVSMLVHVAQMTRPKEIERSHQLMVDDNHAGFGGPPVLEEGGEASFLIHSVSDASTIVRTRAVPRWVLRRGAVVAETVPSESVVLDERLRLGLLD